MKDAVARLREAVKYPDDHYASLKDVTDVLDRLEAADAELARVREELAKEKHAHELEKRAHEQNWNHKAKIIDERDALREELVAMTKACDLLGEACGRWIDRAKHAEDEREEMESARDVKRFGGRDECAVPPCRHCGIAKHPYLTTMEPHVSSMMWVCDECNAKLMGGRDAID